jgi:tetratricopeptide (TPR) repeat protein
MKDLGMKIRTCDLSDALGVRVKFGHNQSMIHSGDDGDSHREAVKDVHTWLNDHPFILSSLESKGLEFDDVVIYFHFPRKTWDTASKKEESLRMLRELYVAVTRAKRRVVILIDKRDIAMRNFIGALECEIEHIKDPKQLQVEFDRETSAELWSKRGGELFDEGRFDLAASCFASGNKWGMSNWAKGKHLRSHGDTTEAAKAFRLAARHFIDDSDYEQALDVLQELSRCPPWDPNDNVLFDKARSEVPAHLNRHETVRLFLVADRWDCIETRDLKNTDTSTLFESYKDHPVLNMLVTKSTEQDRSEISKVLPSLVARYHDQVQEYTSAVELYIIGNEIKLAIESTRRAVDTSKSSDLHVCGCINAWSKNAHAMRGFGEEHYVNLLIRLYQSPLDIAEPAGKKCLQTFGRRVIIFALENSQIEMIHLHDFHFTEFRTEVNQSLESTFSSCVDIVKWYIDKKDNGNAIDYAKRHCKRVTDSELLDIISLNAKILSDDLKTGKTSDGNISLEPIR